MLAVSLAIGVLGAGHDTPTVDEFAHLPAGCGLLVHGSFWHYSHNPPLAKALMAVPVVLSGAEVPAPERLGKNEWAPWLYGERFMKANAPRYLELFFRGRLVMVALSLVGGLLLFAWARWLFGDAGGLLALALWVLCPNLQAHGRLATLDVPVTVALVAAFFALHRAVRAPAAWRFALAGALLGLAAATKFTALVLVPVAAVLAAFGPGEGAGRIAAGVRLLRAGILLLASLLAVDACYVFRGVLRPLDAYAFESATFRAAARILPGSLPVPLPAELLTGLDAEKVITERGEFGTYFAGRWFARAPRLYDAAALVLKLPLATLLLALLALASALAAWRSRRRTAAPAAAPSALSRGDVLFLAAPPLALLLVFTFLNELKIGVRYLLPVLPFLFLAIASLAPRLRLLPRPDARTAFAGLCLLSLAVSTARIHPHQLSFFSALAGGASGGHEWLIDSNLDWGQDLSEVPAWMARNEIEETGLLYFGHVEPALYGIRYTLPPNEPRPGTYVVSVNFAKGYSYVAPDHGRTVRVGDGAPEWLRSRTPDERIGTSLWVYRVR